MCCEWQFPTTETGDVLNMFLYFMFDFMPHIFYSIKIRTLCWPFHAMQLSFFHIPLHYACPMYGTLSPWNTIVIWEMKCNNESKNVINDFNIFVGISITVNNCQSTHTFIGDAVPDHQIYTNTDWSIVGSILRRIVAKKYEKTPSSRNHLQLCVYSIYTMPPFFDIVVASEFWCLFTTHLWYFVQ